MIFFSSSDFAKEDSYNFKEWYLTNGLGTFINYSILDIPIRAYHNLFQYSFSPPAKRFILISGLKEKVNENNLNSYPKELSSKIPISPYLYSFTYFPHAVSYIYKIDDIILKKTIIYLFHSFDVFIFYEALNNKSFTFSITPFFNYRNVDTFEKKMEEIYIQDFSEKIKVITPKLQYYIHFKKGKFRKEKEKYVELFYPYELYRDGYTKEKVKSLGKITFQFNGENKKFCLCFSPSSEPPEIDYNTYIFKKKKNFEKKYNISYTSQWSYLINSLLSFLVKKEKYGKTILAGYPWFMDWGRDTMIITRGLMYFVSKKEIDNILTTFFSFLKYGLIPNCFDSQNSQKGYYNTIDATLWLFVVLYEYFLHFKDTAIIEKNWNKLCEIIDKHIQGTLWNIKVDEDGLLMGGDENTQLTWMDVKINDWAVTPRMGKTVEINALWYNTLNIFKYFAKILNKNPQIDIKRYIQLFRKNFISKFYISSKGYLADYIYKGTINDDLRPNQLFCLALPFNDYIDKEKKRKIFDIVTEHLLTPMGLRTLSPEDKKYRYEYIGDRYNRDSAYHQGTVWPWLIGIYIDAWYNTEKKLDKHKIYDIILPLANQIFDYGLGSISEVFDGDFPHRGGGCFAQGWSVSEILRIYAKYLKDG